jgi:lipoprotein-anchoring transpeptidase ErfK/SrfK
MSRLTRTAAAALALASFAAAPASASTDRAPFPFFFAPLFQPAPQQQAAYAPRAYEPQYQYEERAPSRPQRAARTPTREMVAYDGPHGAGTVVISTRERKLYYVMGNGRAMRYSIGVGREGFQWAGSQTITNKQEWPDWRPPEDMLRRRPDLPRYMAGGPHNPLGARAMYLGSTLYRIHGSNEPDTIGQAVSSGCIRMLNEDVVDLYERVRIGTRVVVLR